MKNIYNILNKISLTLNEILVNRLLECMRKRQYEVCCFKKRKRTINNNLIKKQ